MEYNIILGGTGGLGKEVCKKLAKSGENLYIIARNQDKINLLIEEIKTVNCKINIKSHRLNLSNENEIINFFDLFNKEDKICGLYLCSGVDIQKPFVNYSYEKIIMQTRVNYESCILFTKFAIENKAKSLKILPISSMCGILPMPYYAIYSSLKSALTSFYTSLRYELKKSGIKITILMPGSVPTRSDIINDIKLQGLTGKLSSKPPKYVVDKAFKSLSKNKKICIPGFYNKVVYLVSNVTPKFIKMRVISKKFSKKIKDAF